MTHPGWLDELEAKLAPGDDGLYGLRPDLAAAAGPLPASAPVPRFVPTGEVSAIYKQDGRVRKIHLVVVAPDLAAARRFGEALGRLGNVRSDGRPILGLSARDITEIALTCDPGMEVIPAHVWTPWFSLFGSKSGFDRLEDCFLDLSPHIRALETGLSSDPAMNRLISALDGYVLVSSSDAHSSEKLGREATVIKGPATFETLKAALRGGPELIGTVEFFPEEGKYHLDGHAGCGPALTPGQTREAGGMCPVCGRPLTVGVLSRVYELADRDRPPEGMRPDWHVVPLAELLGQVLDRGPATQEVARSYRRLVGELGPELDILLDVPIADIRTAAGPVLARAVEKARLGEVEASGGYDGLFGTIKVLSKSERLELSGQGVLFGSTPVRRGRPPLGEGAPKSPRLQADPPPGGAKRRPGGQLGPVGSILQGLTAEQLAAVTFMGGDLAVTAGPGSGKTLVLTRRAAFLARRLAGPLAAPMVGSLVDVDAALAALVGAGASFAGPDGAGAAPPAPDGAGAASPAPEGPAPEGDGRPDPGRPSGPDPRAPSERLTPPAPAAPLPILVTTYTRKAAETLSERLSELRSPFAAPLIVSTLHALALSELRSARPGTELAPERLQAAMAAMAARRAGLSPRAFQTALSLAKNRLEPLDSLPDPALRGAALEYQARLDEDRLVDFDDLIARARGLDWRGRFAHVLADEFQDFSLAQLRLLAIMAPPDGLTVIGDPDQGIYGFRGALPRAFESLDAERGRAARLELSHNFRSGPTLVEAAEAARPKPGAPRRAARKAPPEPVGRAVLDRPELEAAWVAERIRASLGVLDLGPGGSSRADTELLPGLALGDVAVLFRLRRQAEAVARSLDAAGLPWQMAGEEPLSSADQLDLKADKIALLTMHAAKGLEFRLVFICGLEDGLFPLRLGGGPEAGAAEADMESPDMAAAGLAGPGQARLGQSAGVPDPPEDAFAEDALAEERRLFYVAATRAKDKLYLTRVKSRTLFGRLLTEPSPFWDLIPERLRRDHKARSVVRRSKLPAGPRLF
jgi:uncharacterized protein (TIGR00375 family)